LSLKFKVKKLSSLSLERVETKVKTTFVPKSFPTQKALLDFLIELKQAPRFWIEDFPDLLLVSYWGKFLVRKIF